MNKVFKITAKVPIDEKGTLGEQDIVVQDAVNETAAKKWLTDAQKALGVDKVEILKIEEILPRPPDNSYEETDKGFYFPAWGIEVSKLEVTGYYRGGRREGQPKFKARNLAGAKAFIKAYHGKDVDKDIPPVLST